MEQWKVNLSRLSLQNSNLVKAKKREVYLDFPFFLLNIILYDVIEKVPYYNSLIK